MTRRARFSLFLAGASCFAVLLVLAVLGLPGFGTTRHQYRDHAVAAAIGHGTANVVSAVNFDQRGIDTLGEESILLGSVVGAAALLRPARREQDHAPAGGGSVLEATRLAGYVVLAVTLLLGIDLIAHGHLTPGGGFQGGVVLATGLHLLYVAGRYPALARLRPLASFEVGEGLGAAAFAGLGVAGMAVAGSFLANVLPSGSFGDLLSAGSVPLLNVAVGVEVACGTVILLAKFLEQAITITGP
ncbi:MAG TPA: MnhB domain-containing protein [Acidimicrobiales bacterium]|nr:MnhB domain-containing protein [Acidimicrobiales bacterium]